MQPYFFPYLGYFQLIHSVDSFVVYDDVNFIKGGWVNRNYLLCQGKPQRVTLELRGASPNLHINQISIGQNRTTLLRSIDQCYRRAPYFSGVYPLIEAALASPENNLARFLDQTLRIVCDYLDLHPRWLLSSSLQKDARLRGVDQVLAICRGLGASYYINLPGGRELYEHETFTREGMRLAFIGTRPYLYRQRVGQDFVPNLSIIDVMMSNSRERCAELVTEYEIG